MYFSNKLSYVISAVFVRVFIAFYSHRGPVYVIMPGMFMSVEYF